MAGFGALLLLLGLGSFILPMIGMQFKFMMWATPYQPWGGIGVAVFGLILVVLDNLGKKKPEGEKKA